VIETVEVIFNGTHSYGGDTLIDLTSPSGATSRLMDARYGTGDSDPLPTDWNLLSYHSWNESSLGDWTLSVSDNWLADTGTWDDWEIRFYGMPALANDLFANATDLGSLLAAPEATYTAHTAASTTEITGMGTGHVDPVPSCATSGAAHRTLWYSFTAPADGTLNLSTAGSNYDTVLTFFDDALGEGACDNNSGPNNTAVLNAAVSNGNTFYIMVSSDNAEYGSLVFNAGFTPDTGTPPGAFTLETPADDAVVTDTSTVTAITWTDAAGALEYDLAVSPSGGAPLIDEAGLTGICDAGTCTYSVSTAQQDALTNGEYTWTVTALNLDGSTVASNAPFSFTVNEPPPGDFTLTSPADGASVVAGSDISAITWAESTGAVTYGLTVERGATDIINDPMLDGAAICTGGTCTYTLTTGQQDALTPGSYSWTVAAANANGSTVASNAPFDFTVGLLAGDPPRIVPADNQALADGDEWPLFQFVDSGEEWYQVWVGPADYSYTGLLAWYPATDNSTGASPGSGICLNDVCTIETDIWSVAANGSYEWWFSYWSNGDSSTDINNSWNETTFSVNYGTPSSPSEIMPSGTVSAAPTEITWPRDSAAIWYQVWVGTADYATTLDFDWFDARQICDDTTCTLPLTGSVADGDYEVWAEAWGPGGYAQWPATPNGTFSVDTSAASTSTSRD